MALLLCYFKHVTFLSLSFYLYKTVPTYDIIGKIKCNYNTQMPPTAPLLVTVDKGSAKVFCKCSENKYLRLCRPSGFCYNYSSLSCSGRAAIGNRYLPSTSALSWIPVSICSEHGSFLINLYL